MLPAEELLDRVREALGDRYGVDREVGRGGMASVFLAEERHPLRQVAIKVLDPRLATGIARERFLREVQFASRLTHPNIVPIFAAGEADGLLYYVMPYIRGHTLRTRLTREGKLTIEDVVQIASEVADALDYAHNLGVVHRDIKPENIMLEAGHAVVVDFGIARALSAAGGADLTLAGFPIGTPAYMSTEQTIGAEVDGRSDVYSLGCVIYEMLVGRPPFQGPTVEALISSRFTKPTPTLRGAEWTGSDTVDRVVQRAMHRDCEERFATTRALIDALRSTVVQTPTPAQGFLVPLVVDDGQKSVAVLPFSNYSADPENEYFSDGITEDIITQLSKIEGVKVTSRTSAMQYKETSKSLGQIGGELGVHHLLEGSVRRVGNRVRVVAQLVDARTDHHVWAEHYDRELTDIFEIQSEIAERIATALETTLSPTEKAKLTERATANVEAYKLYLKGRFFWAKFTPNAVRQGLEFFTQAVDADPEYALAHAGLADAYLILTCNHGQLPARKGMAKAKAAALKALELDETLAEAHVSLGAVYSWLEWNWPAATGEFDRAVELDPESERAHLWRSSHLTALGRHDEAIEEAREAERMSPVSVHASAHVGIQLYMARRYDEVIEQLTKTRELDRTFPPIHVILTWTYLQQRRFDDAVDAARRAAKLTGSPPPRRAALGCAVAAAGKREEAEQILAELKEERRAGYVSAADIGLLAAHLDKTDEAFEWLVAVCEEKSPWMSHLAVDPIWDGLRSDDRFEALLECVGLR